jgi:hydroxymethylpyrimidine pyrophosphatase-like HAD family hydrolase
VGRAYKKDLADLHITFQRISDSDLGKESELWGSVVPHDLITVGSGGAYSAAAYISELHRWATSNLSIPATPLEIISRCIPLTGRACACISAKGRNPDILSAFQTAAAEETSELLAICGVANSPLSRLATNTNRADVIATKIGRISEGYLATNSLLAFCLTLMRIYRIIAGTSKSIPVSLVSLLDSVLVDGRPWHFDNLPLHEALRRRSIMVLHDPGLKSAAVDLEARCIEGALANVHVTDIRNFAHGRHLWLARHEGDSSVLILARPQTSKLADKTAALLPSAIPVHRIDIDGEEDFAALAGLVIAMHIAGWIGEHRGTDPGRPHVPIFGRRLYHLKPQSAATKIRATIEQRAAKRKLAVRTPLRRDCRELQTIEHAAAAFLARLRTARFRALVTDHDGTLVETRSRLAGIDRQILPRLVEVIDSIEIFALVSGRGRSLLANLRELLPERLWCKIFVGLYGGSVFGKLDRLSVSGTSNQELRAIARKITEHLPSSNDFVVDVKADQISVTSEKLSRLQFAYESAAEVVEKIDSANLTIARSAHSIDIFPRGKGKASVFNALRSTVGDLKEEEVLFVGDTGRWPGNDFALLSSQFGLSVDSVSTDLATCWNLSPLGLRNPGAFLYYLQQLRFLPDGRFEFHARE